MLNAANLAWSPSPHALQTAWTARCSSSSSWPWPRPRSAVGLAHHRERVPRAPDRLRGRSQPAQGLTRPCSTDLYLIPAAAARRLPAQLAARARAWRRGVAAWSPAARWRRRSSWRSALFFACSARRPRRALVPTLVLEVDRRRELPGRRRLPARSAVGGDVRWSSPASASSSTSTRPATWPRRPATRATSSTSTCSRSRCSRWSSPPTSSSCSSAGRAWACARTC